jgi:hypothetical protein
MTKAQTIKLSKFLTGDDFEYPSFFKVIGSGFNKEDFNIDVTIGKGRDMINLYLGDYDKANYNFVKDLHAALTKTLDYYETMAKIAVATNPLVPKTKKAVKK